MFPLFTVELTMKHLLIAAVLLPLVAWGLGRCDRDGRRFGCLPIILWAIWVVLLAWLMGGTGAG